MNNELPLHMYVRPLTPEDVDSVYSLECVGFPPSERCSMENINFRISQCPELCSGLFIREIGYANKTPGTAHPHDNSVPQVLGEQLIGHILATKIPASTEYITLDSMSGVHDESSNNIAIHALVIAPQYQKKNLATLLMTDYIQKLSNQEVGTKIVIIAHEHLFPFYERLGFKKIGANENCNLDQEFSANGIWYDMERDLVKDEFDE